MRGLEAALRAAQRLPVPHLANAELQNPVICDTEKLVPAYLNYFRVISGASVASTDAGRAAVAGLKTFREGQLCLSGAHGLSSKAKRVHLLRRAA